MTFAGYLTVIKGCKKGDSAVKSITNTVQSGGTSHTQCWTK